MPTNIVISGVTGQSPYNIYVCDDNISSCVWVSQITSGQIPYSFELPYIYTGALDFAVRITDANGCTVTKLSGSTYPEC
jgi:hypothetical protein